MIAVLHVNSSSADSTSPTMRIARFAAGALQAPLIHDPESAEKHAAKRYDTLFVKYGVLKFSEHRDAAVEVYSKAKRTINMENDYLFFLDRRFSPPDRVWSTVEKRDAYVNWNILTRLPLDTWKTPPLFVEPSNDGLLYYGAFREDRIRSFKRFFKKAKFPVHVSSFRGGAKFAALNPDITTSGAMHDPWAPARWPMTLYIEDETSHGLYCSPATRFYECLQIGLAQAIDERAANTLKKAGFHVPDEFVVSTAKDLQALLPHWKSVRKRQRKLWWDDHGKTLRKQFKAACRREGIT